MGLGSRPMECYAPCVMQCINRVLNRVLLMGFLAMFLCIISVKLKRSALALNRDLSGSRPRKAV